MGGSHSLRRGQSAPAPSNTLQTWRVFRPDILQDTSAEVMLEENRQILEEKPSAAISEDPIRKIYKRALMIIFLITCTSSLLVDILSQVQLLNDKYLSSSEFKYLTLILLDSVSRVALVSHILHLPGRQFPQ